MTATIGYHPLVQMDLNEALNYYEAEAGPEIADRFETEFRMAISAIRHDPLPSRGKVIGSPLSPLNTVIECLRAFPRAYESPPRQAVQPAVHP